MAKSRKRIVQGMGPDFVAALQARDNGETVSDTAGAADAERLHAAIRARGIDMSQLHPADAGQVAAEVHASL